MTKEPVSKRFSLFKVKEGDPPRINHRNTFSISRISLNSRRANFVIMMRTYRTLNDYKMQHNAEVGLFTRPSKFEPEAAIGPNGTF